MALDLSALDDASVARPPSATNGVAALGDLALFHEDPDNPRFEESPEEFAAFVADVRQRGILQPIVVRRLDDGRLRIRFGARRYRAAVRLGLAQIPYVVTEDPRQFDGYAQVAENERRLPLQPLELATFIAKRVATGESRKEVARQLGIHPSAVSHLLCLVGDVPPFLLELYHARRCRTPVFLYRLRQLWRRDPQLVEHGCAAARKIGGTLIERLGRSVRGAVGSGPASAEAKGPAERQTPAQARGPDIDVLAADLGHARGAAAAVQGHPAAGLARLRRPMLYGSVQERAVLVQLSLRPSRDGRIVVRDCADGTTTEVDIRAIRLTKLADGNE